MSDSLTTTDVQGDEADTSVDLGPQDNQAGEDTLSGTDGEDTLVSDEGNDDLTGGDGNDTLEGGGNDALGAGSGDVTLVGGTGDDVFHVSAMGNFVVQDFGAEHDKLHFDAQATGLHDLGDLLAHVTAIEQTHVGVIVHFGDTGSITLVGLSLGNLSVHIAEVS